MPDSAKNCTILAIDDSLTIRKLVDLILKNAGYQVLLAEKGEEGLGLALEHKPSLILLDYILPDMQSPEICKRLLANPATADIPVLMISTNGGAIRQLYADSRNVKDYLTKPFQAKVLLSVITHLLERQSADAQQASAPLELDTMAGATPSTALPFTAARSGTAPAQPQIEPGLGEPARHEPASPARPLANQIASEANASLRALLNTRFRALARMIPELEQRRGKLPAETYYLPFLLRNELLADISAEIGRAQIQSESTQPLIAGTADWMGVDATLLHLGRSGATGVLALRLPKENIEIVLRAGEVLTITSDNPKIYCAGAPFNFRALPAPVIAAAVAAQQRSRVPFFVTIYRAGAHRDQAELLGLIRQQAARALHRAMGTPGARYAFIPRETVADPAPFALAISPRQAVLESLRLVDDWLEIESATGSVETVFKLVPGTEDHFAQLVLNAEERAVLERTDGASPLQEIAAAANLGLYETCAVVFRFLKLQLLAIETNAAPTSARAVQDFLDDAGPAGAWPSGTEAESSPTPNPFGPGFTQAPFTNGQSARSSSLPPPSREPFTSTKPQSAFPWPKF
jgi:CheY-like chemotaxis protein